MKTLDAFFHISARGSTIPTEIRAGLTTFVTMAYILPVNMGILAAAGLDAGAVFMATALSAVVGTALMGLLAGLPFALAPGMGLNAFFAYTVVLTMGFTPGFALAAVLAEGVIFLVLSVTGVRTKLLEAIPGQLRLAIAAGIGLFIMFIGLQNAGIVLDHAATLVTINPAVLTQASTCLAVAGTAITAGLWLRKVRGALLLGILITWVLGMFAQFAGWYAVNPEAGAFSLLPRGVVSVPPGLGPTLGLCFAGIREAFSDPGVFGSFVVVTLTFLYVDIFDTLGTFTGVMTKARLITGNGEFPGADRAFTSDAVATTLGAVLGTSTVTTYVESAAGVEEGGRTGLTAVTAALLFLLSIVFFPVISAIPAFATAPALIMVGVMMCEPMADFEWKNPEALIPGIMTVIFMVTGYSISAGIMWGVLFYLATCIAVGKFREPPVIMWLLGILFLLKLAFLN